MKLMNKSMSQMNLNKYQAGIAHDPLNLMKIMALQTEDL